MLILASMSLIFARYGISQVDSGREPEIAPKPNRDSTEIQKQTVQAIMERYGPDLRGLSVNSKGIVYGFFGSNLNKGLTAKDPKGRVFQFLEINKDILKIENPKKQLRFVDYDRTELKFPDVSLEQVENDVLVWGGLYNFRFIKDSSGVYQIRTFMGNFFPEASAINTKPSISADRALQIAFEDTICREENPSLDRAPTLYIRDYDKQLKLVWSVNLNGINTCETKIYIFNIDAQSGKVLASGCRHNMPF